MTLIELVISSSIMVVVLGGLSGAVVLASKSADARNDPDSATFDASSAIEQLVGELAVATSVTQRGPAAVTFTVADRDGDNMEETIAYSWGGSGGDPLTRVYNSGPTQIVMTEVDSFDLEFADVTTQKTESGLSTVDPDQSVYGQSRLVTGNYDIDSTSALAQPIKQSLPADAIAWKPVSVSLALRHSGSQNGRIVIELRAANNNGSPTDRILTAISINEADLPSGFSTRSYPIDDAPWLGPSQKICVVVLDAANTTSANAPLATELDLTSGFWYGNPATSSWTASLTASMPAFVRADIRRPAPDNVETTGRVGSVECELTVNGRTVRGSSLMHNQPEAP